MKQTSLLTALLLVFLGTAIIARAQIPAPPPAPQAQLLSTVQLDQMLGPIALYPDPLIAEILPAATLPSEIVLADRYVSGGGDPNLIDQQPWDPSIKALARYPTVLRWMDDNLAWTTALGQAFLYQQQDVMNSIQRLRAQALALGNLQSTPQASVVTDNGAIEILPANPQVIYVPVYQPNVVFYQRAYGSPFISFGLGFVLGAWLNHDFDWHDHHLIVWGHAHPRPPDWWSRRPSARPRAEVAHASVWQPRNRSVLTGQTFDRGWNSNQGRSTVTVIGSANRPAEAPRARPANNAPGRSTVTIVHSQSQPVAAPRERPASGAFIGIQSSHETRQYSARGQESRQTIHSQPAARSAAPSHSEAPNRSGGGARR